MFPAGIEYEPSALTLMRLILPRRSLVFCAERRASTNGAWNQSASCVVAIVTACVPVPVRPLPLEPSSGTSFWAFGPSNHTVWKLLPALAALPVTLMSRGSMLLSASSAALVCAAVALNGSGAVVWPL